MRSGLHRFARLEAAGVIALMTVLGLAVLALAGSAAPAGNTSSLSPTATALDIGPTGTASATTAASGAPASNAIDGSASTNWCSTEWTGTLTVDLGAARRLDGFGLTLGRNATTASVSLAYATVAGDWQRPKAAQQMSVPAAEPVYLPLSGGGADVRHVQVSVTDNDGTPPCIGALRLFARAHASVLPQRGADLSFEPQEEEAGAVFTDNGKRGSALQILNSHGLNYVRLRLWVNPPPGYPNLERDLKMAKRIAAAGDKLYLDIHYSDFWADPQHQDIPAAWQGQDLTQLARTVESYTHDVIAAFAAQGTPVDMVSIGNEIRNGMLWPVGQVDWSADTGWDNLTTLLKAGVAGARSGNPGRHPLAIMLHFDEGGNNANSVRFYDHMVAAGVPFDVIGLSYYTFFHGPLTALRDNVNDLATRYGKKIVIAESQYAWTLAAGNDSTGNFVWQAGQIEPGYPATPGGQLSFYNDLLSILSRVPNHLAIGLFYWEPEWIPGVGWEPGAGTPNDNLTLFSFTGAALPAVGLFRSPLSVCAAYAPSTLPCVVPNGASYGGAGM